MKKGRGHVRRRFAIGARPGSEVPHVGDQQRRFPTKLMKCIYKKERTYNMKLLLQSFLPISTGMTSLERIVATRAMGATIVNQLTSEISFERVMFELTNVNFHSTNLWVLSVLAIYLYSRFQYYEGVQSKLKDIEVYDRYKRLIREVMFIVFLVFTRDVQHAT